MVSRCGLPFGCADLVPAAHLQFLDGTGLKRRCRNRERRHARLWRPRSSAGSRTRGSSGEAKRAWLKRPRGPWESARKSFRGDCFSAPTVVGRSSYRYHHIPANVPARWPRSASRVPSSSFHSKLINTWGADRLLSNTGGHPASALHSHIHGATKGSSASRRTSFITYGPKTGSA